MILAAFIKRPHPEEPFRLALRDGPDGPPQDEAKGRLEGCWLFDLASSHYFLRHVDLPVAILQALQEREKRITSCHVSDDAELSNEEVVINHIPGVGQATRAFLNGRFAHYSHDRTARYREHLS